MPSFVLVHGAFHGPWCFDLVIDRLRAQGSTAIAPELPLTSLADDTAAVTAALDDVHGPVILVGHSYGGAVITAAGVHPRVERLVYLAALVPDVGEPPSGGPTEIGSAFLAALQPTDDGLLSVDPHAAPGAFFPDADPTVAAAWATKLRPGLVGLPGERLDVAAWRHRPTDYVVCDDDPILLAPSQRAIATRARARVHELPGDHSPFLARPDELTARLLEIATTTGD